MKTLDAIQVQNSELSGKILFLKKEIDFLLKILRNCYSSSVQADKIKLMDSFWKGFEQNTNQLDLILTHIEQEERKNASLYRNVPEDSLVNDKKQSEFQKQVASIQAKLQSTKENFYEFMQGCSACALKQH